MDIKNTISIMFQQIENFKLQIISNIKDIPDNSKIKRMSKNPHCFILNFKDLENNWSPEYYDSKFQAQTIIKIIKEKENLITIQNMLNEIVEQGTYRVVDGHRMFFNKQVREFIKKLL